jgi:hypothetical protein
MRRHGQPRWGGARSGGQAARPALAALSDLIGEIYDCVLDPSRWESVLVSVCRELSFASSILGVVRLPRGPVVCQIVVGIEQDWLARIPEFGPEILELWGGIERIRNYPIDEPIVNSQSRWPDHRLRDTVSDNGGGRRRRQQPLRRGLSATSANPRRRREERAL